MIYLYRELLLNNASGKTFRPKIAHRNRPNCSNIVGLKGPHVSKGIASRGTEDQIIDVSDNSPGFERSISTPLYLPSRGTRRDHILDDDVGDTLGRWWPTVLSLLGGIR